MPRGGGRRGFTGSRPPATTHSPSPSPTPSVGREMVGPQPEPATTDSSDSTEPSSGPSHSEVGSSVSVPRTKIHLSRDFSTGEIIPHTRVARICGKSIQKVPNPTGTTWFSTPESVKASYWIYSKNFSTWDADDEADVYTMWKAKIRVRFSGFLSNAKIKRDPEKEEQGRPKKISPDWWRSLCAHWDKPEVIAQSQRKRANRMSEPDGPNTGISKHSGGSKSVNILARELAAQRNVPLQECVYEAFRAIHTKRDGSFVTSRDAEIDARVQELAQEQGEGADVNEIYRAVVAERDAQRTVKKKRMYGTCSLAPTILSGCSSGVGGSSTTSQLQGPNQILPEVVELRDQLKEEREKREQLEEQVKKMMEMFQSQMNRPDSSGGSH